MITWEAIVCGNLFALFYRYLLHFKWIFLYFTHHQSNKSFGSKLFGVIKGKIPFLSMLCCYQGLYRSNQSKSQRKAFCRVSQTIMRSALTKKTIQLPTYKVIEVEMAMGFEKSVSDIIYIWKWFNTQHLVTARQYTWRYLGKHTDQVEREQI